MALPNVPTRRRKQTEYVQYRAYILAAGRGEVGLGLFGGPAAAPPERRRKARFGGSPRWGSADPHARPAVGAGARGVPARRRLQMHRTGVRIAPLQFVIRRHPGPEGLTRLRRLHIFLVLVAVPVRPGRLGAPIPGTGQNAKEPPRKRSN